MWAGFLEPRGPDRNGLVAQLRFRVDHKLVEKGVGGLVSFVEEGHPSCSMLSLGGLVLGNVDGDLKKPRAPRGMDVNLERSIDEEILSVASTVEAIVAPVADESLWEEASRYSSLVPRLFIVVGVGILLLSLGGIRRWWLLIWALGRSMGWLMRMG